MTTFHSVCNWVAFIGVAIGGVVASVATAGVALPSVVLGLGAAAGVLGGVASKYALSPVHADGTGRQGAVLPAPATGPRKASV